MIGNYLKTAVRSIGRNRLFSTINILGLAMGLSVGMLLITLLHDLLLYDRFHANGDRIYRIRTTYQSGQAAPEELASTSVKIGKICQNQLSGVQAVVMLQTGLGSNVTVGEKTLPLNGLWASESFFKLFTFPLLAGNPATALQEPHSMVLTQKAAHKLFGDQQALNQVLRVDSIDFTVTGVMQDIPFHSHLQFEALASFATLEQAKKADPHFLSWDNPWNTYVYLLLPTNSDAHSVRTSLEQISQQENAQLAQARIQPQWQPLHDIFLGQDLHQEIGHSVPTGILWVGGALTLIVLLSACFNYMNLSIARSLRRSREVGVRKVLGAFRGQVITQFVLEAVVIALLALVVSSGLFVFLRAALLSGPGPAKLDLSLGVVVAFFVLAVGVGLAAGIFPAVVLAGIQPVQVLKARPSLRLFGHLAMRKALIFLQYTFSLLFIAATLIVYRQYAYFIAQDLGFHPDNIVNVALQGNPVERVKEALATLPEVRELSQSQMVTGVYGSKDGTWVKYGDGQDSAMVFFNKVDENYVPLHGYHLLAGRNLQARTTASEIGEVLINEQLLQRFRLGDNDSGKAPGTILLIDGKPYQVVGVLKDFHYGTLYQKIEPVFFGYAPQQANYVNVKVSSATWPTTLAQLETAWKQIDRVHPLLAQRYEQEIEQSYQPLMGLSKMMGSLAFLTIFIASMGLFGMVVFTAETRQKEVSIRKVLGASEANLVYLLSKGFLWLLLVAALLAFTITDLVFEQVVSQQLVNHAPWSWLDLLGILVLFMGLAMVIIGSQTIRVARKNPAQVLKAE